MYVMRGRSTDRHVFSISPAELAMPAFGRGRATCGDCPCCTSNRGLHCTSAQQEMANYGNLLDGH